MSPFPTDCSSHFRLSMISTLLVQLFRSVCANSETFVAPGQYSQHRTRFRAPFTVSGASPSPREVPATCTKGSSKAQGFPSNAPGYTPRAIQRQPRECVIEATAHFPLLTSPVDALSRSCSVETLDTPEHRTPPRHHPHSSPTYLGMDDWREPDRIHQEKPRRRPAWACGYPSCCAHSTLTPLLAV